MAELIESFQVRLNNLTRYSDLLIAAAVVAIVILIVLPIPTQLLDILLACSLTIGLIMLLSTLFIQEPLQLAIFPTLLLVFTLFRLALNISSTRLILTQANAGRVIEAFGSFVIGGNYIVGAVVFVIITVIQFVVITNGAGRTAEVAARFTLDAMPGKQMSIDADLSAGLISEQEARERRSKLQREANFFGAMDGASKFVKGDAIAGIVIALVNIAAGLAIGMWQLGLPAQTALHTYTLLTVGDGLVSQIPALLASTATGVLVTRTESGHSFGFDLTKQLGKFPPAIGLAAGILLALAVLPGLPFLPFIILSMGVGYTAYALFREEKIKAMQNEQKELSRPALREPEKVLNLFQVDPLEIEIGYNLIPLIDEQQGGDLLNRLAAVRKQCATEMGIYVRPIRIRDNLQLSPNSYRFKIRGVEMTGGELMPNHYMAMSPYDENAKIQGIKTTEPTFGLPAWWIKAEDKEKAEMECITVVDPATVLITHLTEFIKLYAHEILSRQDVQDLLDMVQENNSALVKELVPNILSVGEIQKVLQNLLKEKISIRDLETILEAVADAALVSKNLDFLIDSSRLALSRSICRQLSKEGHMIIATLESSLENKLLESLQNTPYGNYPAISAELTQHIFDQLDKIEEKFTLLGSPPVVLCSPRIRLPFRRLIERYKPSFSVVSVNEVSPDLKIEVIESVVMPNED
ncbi:MAG: flagellar biosynthesis protein FlhA [Syntrophomonadaceae bacterium]|jgi:flagellar biosynthesis protein FlhA